MYGMARNFRTLPRNAVWDRARYGKLNEEDTTTWTDVAHWDPYLRIEIPFLVRLCVVLQTFIAQTGFISSVRQHGATLGPIATTI